MTAAPSTRIAVLLHQRCEPADACPGVMAHTTVAGWLAGEQVARLLASAPGWVPDADERAPGARRLWGLGLVCRDVSSEPVRWEITASGAAVLDATDGGAP